MPATGALAERAGAARLVLVLNSGSSSVKFALLSPESSERVMDGIGARLGTPEASLRVQWSPEAPVDEALPDADHHAVVARVLDHLARAGHTRDRLLGTGHRVVHGGERFTASVDTTMGLTPLEGLVMGTRSGDVDPGLLGYLASRTGLGVDELTHMLNVDSGLVGLSGVANDMRTIAAAAATGNDRSRLALEVFVHRLAKAVAGLVVGLQRIDALVFTGGIGENSVLVRSLVLGRLGFLGLTEDPEANADHGRHTDGRISLSGPVVALVVPTDEELLIARDTARVITDP
jgi:acetate kinase